MIKDIRWIQRLENFGKALLLLEEAADMVELSDLEKEGLVQRFEYTFELTWKTIKDFLENRGVTIEIKSPKDVLKTAFEVGIISEQERWMEMMVTRNLLAHTYNKEHLEISIEKIRENYLCLIKTLYEFLKGKSLEK